MAEPGLNIVGTPLEEQVKKASVAMPEVPPLHVQVRFGKDIPYDARNKAMLEFERLLRKLTGLRIETFQEKQYDDSRLRAAMTSEQRAKL